MTDAIDTSVWVTYFQGDRRTKRLIEEGELVTSTIAIAELAALFAKQGMAFEKELLFIKSRAKIIPLTTELALDAARIKTARRKERSKFGLADAMHYATAAHEKARLVTTDTDFKGMRQVLVLDASDG